MLGIRMKDALSLHLPPRGASCTGLLNASAAKARLAFFAGAG